MDLTEFGIGQLAKQYGPFIAFVAFTLWQGWRRETKCGERMKALETTIQNSLIRLVKRNTVIVTKNNSFLQRLEALLFRNKRPRKSSASKRPSR